MSSDGKKISFSFSKVKKSNLVTTPKIETGEKIDYVDCFDGAKGKFSYKGNVRSDETKKQELVIPMPSTKTSLDILRSRIEEKQNNAKEESNGIDSLYNKTDVEKPTIQDFSRSLDELATLEILNETTGVSDEKKSNGLVIVSKKEVNEASEAEIDYDNIPVSDFGMALLRGMGWKPGAGIGKDPRLVEAVSPKVRPKGLGLGAKLNPEVTEENVKEKQKNKSKEKEEVRGKDKIREKEKNREKEKTREERRRH